MGIFGLAVSGSAENALPDMMQNLLDRLPDRVVGFGLRILLTAVLFLVGVHLIKLVRRIVKKSMMRANAELGAIQFTDSFIKAALYVLLVMMLASSFGLDAASVVAVLGSAGVAIGLAVQDSLSNLAGGVLILVLKPFKVGDYIKESFTGHEGTVSQIQIFYTELVTPDNQTVILPNGNLANNSLVNVTMQEARRMDVKVRISYEEDLRAAKEVLLQVVTEEEASLKDRDLLVFVDELAPSCVILNVRCWFRQEDFWQGKWRVAENCKLKLEEKGIRIAPEQLVVHVEKKDGDTGRQS